MNKIIRLNAVETSRPGGGLGMKLKDLHPDYDLVTQELLNYISVPSVMATLTPQGVITKEKVRHLQQFLTLRHLVQLNSEAVFATFGIWAWTRKIAKVAHTEGNQITTLKTEIHVIVSSLIGYVIVKAQAVLSRLALLLFCRKLTSKVDLLKVLAITELPSKISATTTLGKNSKTKLKKQSHLQAL